MIVVDSHRPHNLENVYIDANETDHGKEVSRARVILLDEEWNEHPMPTMETLVAADENGDEEEDENEDEDDDDDLRSPGQRRRLDEEGEREDDKESRQKLREKKELRRESRNELSEYYKGTYRGRSAALTMFQLATQLHKDTNDMLWWAIIGLTEQYVNDLTDRQRYESEVSALPRRLQFCCAILPFLSHCLTGHFFVVPTCL